MIKNFSNSNNFYKNKIKIKSNNDDDEDDYGVFKIKLITYLFIIKILKTKVI